MNNHMAAYCDYYFELMWRRDFTPNDESAEDRLLSELDRCWYKMSDEEIRNLENFLNLAESLKTQFPSSPFYHHYAAIERGQMATPLKAA